MSKKYRYRVSYKTLKSPDRPLSDPKNIKIQHKYFRTKKEAEGWFKSVEMTAGEWDPELVEVDLE